jgi:hypothetical protein
MPQSTPHPKKQNTHHDARVSNHLLDQLSLSFRADPDILGDGEESDFQFLDDGQGDHGFVEGKEDTFEDHLDDFWDNEMKEYEEDDTFLPKPLELPAQASSTKPKVRGRPKKTQESLKRGKATKTAQSKGAVSDSDEESPDSEAGASQYLYMFQGLTRL